MTALLVRRVDVIAWLLLAAVLLGGRPVRAQLPAFVGAVGQGAAAAGGRGGDVYHVTNLFDYDSGEPNIGGSLRYGIQSATGPRTIVFDVGGPLALVRPLSINKDNLTIAGQTSPSGVTLWGYPTYVAGAEDVVIRFLRFRTGDFNVQTANPDGTPTNPVGGNGNMDLLGQNADAVSIHGGAKRVILDHVSASWSIDETLSVSDSHNVTVQHSIIANSLNDSLHHKGEHGYGSLVRGDLTPAEQAAGEGGYTFYGNLWAAHKNRNPLLGGQQNLAPGQAEEDRRGIDVNLINNVLYNRSGTFTHRVADSLVRANMIGNYYAMGPEKPGGTVFLERAAGVTVLYQENNFVDPWTNQLHDGFEISTSQQVAGYFGEFDAADTLISPGEGEPLNFIASVADHVLSAPEAYDRVVAGAGASLWRDAIDARTIDELTSRTGAIIDSQEELRVNGVLHGLDDLPATQRPAGFDSDGDGMPDDFETARGLDPGNPADRNGTDLSPAGYTNLEFYLDWLVRDLFDPLAANADFDRNGLVAGRDFLAWQRGVGGGVQFADGDANGDGVVDADDLISWQAQFGAPAASLPSATIAEPATALLALVAALTVQSIRLL